MDAAPKRDTFGVERPNLQDIERRAEAGEAAAQYALAAALAARQQAEAARLWLERAAAQGHADALFTLAGAVLTTTEAARERRTEAIDGLKAARDKGSVAALRVLAALKAAGLDGEADWTAALSMMREACELGDAAAMREVAAVFLDVSRDGEQGQRLLSEAAKKDHIAAALLRRRQLRRRETQSGPISWNEIFDRLALPAAAIAEQEICGKPRVRAVRGAFVRDLCDHLIAIAAPRLKREMVLGADGNRRVDPHRTAWGALIGFGFADLPAIYAGLRLAGFAGLPYSHGEAISILRYLPGQEYRPHHDYLSPNDPDLPAHGQRLRTALLYLNEEYTGGETFFLKPKLKFAGQAGDALIFHNVDEQGATDASALHAGLAIQSGEKWIASLWLRDRPFAG